ncbi:MAG: hexose kinase [Candidatus Omnitrophota bacterium]
MTTIRTLTLNPVIDLIYSVDRFEKGSTFRCDDFLYLPAGKGINVTNALACMGESSCAYLPLGKDDVPLYIAACRQRPIELHYAAGDFRIRRHCTILERKTGSVTHAQTRGETMPPALMDELVEELVGGMEPEDIAILSGSVPPGVSPSIYAEIITRCQKKGARTILDASGPPLREGAAAQPFLLKINQNETEQLLGESMTEAADIVREIHRRFGIPRIVISLGEKGAVAGGEEGIIRLRLPMDPSEVRDTVGCGDAMTGGIAWGMKRDLPWEEICRCGIAWASAAACCAGPAHLDPHCVEKMLDRVEIRRMVSL